MKSYRFKELKEKSLMWIAWHLPRRLVEWCYPRVHSYAISTEYTDKHPDEVTWLMALKCWRKDKK